MAARKKSMTMDAAPGSPAASSAPGDDGAEVAEERVEVVRYAAAIDVAKGFGMVCTRVPGGRPDRKRQTVWQAEATYDQVVALMDHLRCQGIQRLVLESTSVIRGHRSAYAMEADGPALTVPPSVMDGLSGDCLRRRHPTAALISRLPLVAAAFALPVTDVSVTARPGQCPISPCLPPG